MAGEKGILREQLFDRVKAKPLQQLEHMGIIQRRRISRPVAVMVHVLGALFTPDQRTRAADAAAHAAHPLEKVAVDLAGFEPIQQGAAGGDT